MSLTYSELEKIIQKMSEKEKQKNVLVGKIDWLRVDSFSGEAADDVFEKDGEFYIVS